MNFRSVLYILGILISTLGCMMLFPALCNYLAQEQEWRIFASTGIICFFIGITIILAFKSKNLISATYDSMTKAISIVKDGIHLGDIGETIQKYVEKNFKLRLLLICHLCLEVF